MSWLEYLRETVRDAQLPLVERKKIVRPKQVSLETGDEIFIRFRGQVSELLNGINQFVLDGRGEVTEWVEKVTAEHRHRREGTFTPGVYYLDSQKYWTHPSSRRLETRLSIPDVGVIIVFADIGPAGYIGRASELRILSTGVDDQEQVLCDQVGKKIPLGYPEDYFPVRLKKLLAYECIRIHKAV